MNVRPLIPDVASILIHLAVYGAVVGVTGAGGGPIPALLLAAGLIWVSVVDFQRYIIPDAAVALLAAGGAFRIWQTGVDPLDPVLAAFVWPAAFWSVAAAFHRFRGMSGLGFGDVKLAGALGLWVGLEGMVAVVLTASLGGIAVLLLGHATGRVRRPVDAAAIAFGPYLCLSAWAVWLQGTGG